MKFSNYQICYKNDLIPIVYIDFPYVKSPFRKQLRYQRRLHNYYQVSKIEVL